MGKLLLRCINCHHYSMRGIIDDPDISQSQSDPAKNKNIKREDTKKCLQCGNLMITPHPARFSMDNRWASYLRQMKALSAQSDTQGDNN